MSDEIKQKRFSPKLVYAGIAVAGIAIGAAADHVIKTTDVLDSIKYQTKVIAYATNSNMLGRQIQRMNSDDLGLMLFDMQCYNRSGNQIDRNLELSARGVEFVLGDECTFTVHKKRDELLNHDYLAVELRVPKVPVQDYMRQYRARTHKRI